MELLKSLVVIDCLRPESASPSWLGVMRPYMEQTEKEFAWHASVAVLALRINMRGARYGTPGMRIPLLDGYRPSKRLTNLWREYSLSSVA